MKEIYIIVGRTGAGKSTLCKKLSEYFNYPLLSFAGMGKKFANLNGYNRIRDCRLGMGLYEFKIRLSEYFINIIKDQMKMNDNIIIDGLYIDILLELLKESWSCKIIHIKTEDIIRYKRVSERLSCTLEQARIENEIKERIKNELGIDQFITNADYIVDGNKTMDEVFLSTKQFIENSHMTNT